MIRGLDWINSARKQREIDHIPKYGLIQPKKDKRCFRREMVEELLDSLNYCEWAKIKGEITQRQYQSMDADIRRAIMVLKTACEDKFSWETNWI